MNTKYETYRGVIIIETLNGRYGAYGLPQTYRELEQVKRRIDFRLESGNGYVNDCGRLVLY